MNWRRFDTLALRLFLLMWGTLVASHLVAFLTVTWPGAPEPPDRPPMERPGPLPRERNLAPPGDAPARLPTLPSLPPGNPFGADAPGGAGLPRATLWLDYGLRMLVIAFGAALGARWLSRPMRRLARASTALADNLAQGRGSATLAEDRGTQEVRETARIFNHMARRLREQFDARSLHMAALSHDLRTPLTRLRMRLESLPETVTGAAAADIREMDEMVAGTLAVLREQRDGDVARAVDLVSLLQSIADDRAELGHPVELASGAALRSRAHPAALRRIVGNLVDNALHYGDRARLSLDQAGPGRVAVHVDDDGPGIPADQLEQAFEPWVRLDSGRSRAGHGLGLAIARELAERDGGRLTLANRPGGGLRATLELPAA